MLVKMHPDVTKLVERWGRWHHEVDYSPFKNIPLIKKDGFVIPNQINEYGMRLVNES
jgi:hypothetical protein